MQQLCNQATVQRPLLGNSSVSTLFSRHRDNTPITKGAFLYSPFLGYTGVSKRTLQWHSKCCCVASVTKMFTIKGVQTTHRSRRNTWNTIVNLFLKHTALPVEVTLNHKLSQIKFSLFYYIMIVQNTVHVVWINYISFQSFKGLFETHCITRTSSPFVGCWSFLLWRWFRNIHLSSSCRRRREENSV
jgi:hypothetical protein